MAGLDINRTIDFNKLCGLCISRLGLTPSNFYDLTPVEFLIAMTDQQEREFGLTETLIKTQWEVARVELLHHYNMTPGLRKRPKKPIDVFKLAWDEAPKPLAGQQSLEEMRLALIEIHAKNKMKIKTNKQTN